MHMIQKICIFNRLGYPVLNSYTPPKKKGNFRKVASLLGKSVVILQSFKLWNGTQFNPSGCSQDSDHLWPWMTDT